MSDIDVQGGASAGEQTRASTTSGEAGEVAAPLSTSLKTGAMDTQVAGMMGALLTRLDEVTGGRPVSSVPEPPPVVQAGGSKEASALSVLSAAPARMREVAAHGGHSAAQSDAIDRAAEVVEHYAALRQEAVLKASG